MSLGAGSNHEIIPLLAIFENDMIHILDIEIRWMADYACVHAFVHACNELDTPVVIAFGQEVSRSWSVPVVVHSLPLVTLFPSISSSLRFVRGPSVDRSIRSMDSFNRFVRAKAG
jgi:hypothetical protein